MDENQYRQTYQQVNALPCVFERAILRQCAICHHAQRLNIAEREAVSCQSESDRKLCREFLGLMHQKSQFAVKADNPDEPLPFGKEIKIQCGALLGLKTEMSADTPIDINLVLLEAVSRYSELEAFPFESLIREVTAFRTRRPRKD
jgi:hypothetical protein